MWLQDHLERGGGASPGERSWVNLLLSPAEAELQGNKDEG